MNRDEVIRRYPRIVVNVIAESLGYATPSLAARIVADATEGRANHCEWVASCYRGNARKVVETSIRRRHHHQGYMADYRQALALVRQYAETGEQPVFASWF